jgi:hypothetical protein
MRKKFDTANIMSELSGQSAFFPGYQRDNQPETKETSTSTPKTEQMQPVQNEIKEKASEHASMHASTLASDDLIEETRKMLKLLGKEVVYVRSTLEEKEQISDIVYTLKRQGIKTSDNEICRIAINVILAEYKTNGEQSFLAKVLKALHT